MSHVLGASLKAAMVTAAAKQVAAAGLVVQSTQVTFAGSTAYAVWESPVVRWGQPNGRAFKINYPALNDAALLSRVEADLIAAYTLHETGHVCYTNNDDGTVRAAIVRAGGDPVKRSLIHPIANAIEDGRMEASVIAAGIARNSRQLFRRLLNKISAEAALDGAWNPTEWVHSAFAVAMLSREALGNGNASTATLLGRIPEPKRSLYAELMERVRKAPLGYDEKAWAYETATWFYLAWLAQSGSRKSEGGEAGPQPPDEDNDLKDREEEEFEEDFEAGDDAIEEPPPSKDGEKGEGEGSGGEDGGEGEGEEIEDEEDDGRGEGDKGDDGDGDDEGDEGGHGDGEGDPGDEGESSDGDPGDGEGEESDDGDDGEGGPDGDDDGECEGGRSDPFSSGDGKVDGRPNDAEPSVDDIFKRANKRTDGSKKSTLFSIQPAEQKDALAILADYAGEINDRPRDTRQYI